MRSTSILVSAALFLTGCSFSAGTEPGTTSTAARENVAEAVQARYPGDVQPTANQAVVVDHPGDRTITIYNLTDRSITSPMVWVNKTYVHRVGDIPPHGHLTVSYRKFFEAGRGVTDLATAGGTVQRVELQSGNDVIAALGPVH